MKLPSTLFLLITGGSSLYADSACIDNSAYGDLSCGLDYKKYHHVACTCPCDRYAHSFHRGLCEQCLHFRKTDLMYASAIKKVLRCHD